MEWLADTGQLKTADKWVMSELKEDDDVFTSGKSTESFNSLIIKLVKSTAEWSEQLKLKTTTRHWQLTRCQNRAVRPGSQGRATQGVAATIPWLTLMLAVAGAVTADMFAKLQMTSWFEDTVVLWPQPSQLKTQIAIYCMMCLLHITWLIMAWQPHISKLEVRHSQTYTISCDSLVWDCNENDPCRLRHVTDKLTFSTFATANVAFRGKPLMPAKDHWHNACLLWNQAPKMKYCSYMSDHRTIIIYISLDPMPICNFQGQIQSTRHFPMPNFRGTTTDAHLDPPLLVASRSRSQRRAHVQNRILTLT